MFFYKFIFFPWIDCSTTNATTMLQAKHHRKTTCVKLINNYTTSTPEVTLSKNFQKYRWDSLKIEVPQVHVFLLKYEGFGALGYGNPFLRHSLMHTCLNNVSFSFSWFVLFGIFTSGSCCSALS